MARLLIDAKITVKNKNILNELKKYLNSSKFYLQICEPIPDEINIEKIEYYSNWTDYVETFTIFLPEQEPIILNTEDFNNFNFNDDISCKIENEEVDVEGLIIEKYPKEYDLASTYLADEYGEQFDEEYNEDVDIPDNANVRYEFEIEDKEIHISGEFWVTAD